ncbi:hypothetical protein, partial [Kitasatospora sp. NPDC094015]|uniref:WXG100-like domain-containing protein n=1 Tax=Kitasatospora sp. NPDC094015 TaxID=3155205 RepID=UPI0033232301
MAVELPEPLQWVLLLLAGTRWPEADEDMLRDMAERWRQGSETLADAGKSADAALKRALEGQEGEAAKALSKHWDQFTVGKGTEADPGYFPGLVQACSGMGDMLEAMANSAETAKIQIIAQLGILAFEIATAEAEAPFTAGVSLAQIPVAVGISRTVVQQILKTLLKEALEFAAKQAAQMAAINLLAQGIEVMEGHRKSIDMKELGQNALGGAVAGASGHLIGKGLSGAGSKMGLAGAMSTVPGKMVHGAAVGVGADVSTQLITTGHVEGGSLLGSGLSGGAAVGLKAGASNIKGRFNGPGNIPTPHSGPPPKSEPVGGAPIGGSVGGGSSIGAGGHGDGTPTFSKPDTSASAFHGPGAGSTGSGGSSGSGGSGSGSGSGSLATAGGGGGGSVGAGASGGASGGASHAGDGGGSTPTGGGTPRGGGAGGLVPFGSDRPAASGSHGTGESPGATPQTQHGSADHTAPPTGGSSPAPHQAPPTTTDRAGGTDSPVHTPPVEHTAPVEQSAPVEHSAPRAAEPTPAPATASGEHIRAADAPVASTTHAAPEPHAAPAPHESPVTQPQAHTGTEHVPTAAPHESPVTQEAPAPRGGAESHVTPEIFARSTPEGSPAQVHAGAEHIPSAAPHESPVAQPQVHAGTEHVPSATPHEAPPAQVHAGTEHVPSATPHESPVTQPQAHTGTEHVPTAAPHESPVTQEAPAPRGGAESHVTPEIFARSTPEGSPAQVHAGTEHIPSAAPHESPVAQPQVHAGTEHVPSATPHEAPPVQTHSGPEHVVSSAPHEAVPSQTPTQTPVQSHVPMASTVPSGSHATVHPTGPVGSAGSSGASVPHPSAAGDHGGATPHDPDGDAGTSRLDTAGLGGMSVPTLRPAGGGDHTSRTNDPAAVPPPPAADASTATGTPQGVPGMGGVHVPTQGGAASHAAPPPHQPTGTGNNTGQAGLGPVHPSNSAPSTSGNQGAAGNHGTTGGLNRPLSAQAADRIHQTQRDQRQAELDALRQNGRRVDQTAQDLGREQRFSTVRPPNADALVRDLPTATPHERAGALAVLPPAQRRWMAKDPAFVDALKAGLPPKEFAKTAAQLMVDVDPRAGRPASARAEAQAQAERMLQDPDVAARLLKNGAGLVIVPKDVSMTDVSAFHDMRGTTAGGASGGGRGWDDVRGSGGRRAAVTEENLLGEDTTIGNATHYQDGYSTTTHEFAHTIHLNGLEAGDRSTITTSYQNKRNDPNAVWSDGPRHDLQNNPVDNYASRDELEYFAQVTNAYLGTNHGTDPHTGQDRNNGPAWVRANEPALVPLLERLYGPDPTAVHNGPANPVNAVRAENDMYEGLRDFTERVENPTPAPVTPAPVTPAPATPHATPPGGHTPPASTGTQTPAPHQPAPHQQAPQQQPPHQQAPQQPQHAAPQRPAPQRPLPQTPAPHQPATHQPATAGGSHGQVPPPPSVREDVNVRGGVNDHVDVNVHPTPDAHGGASIHEGANVHGGANVHESGTVHDDVNVRGGSDEAPYRPGTPEGMTHEQMVDSEFRLGTAALLEQSVMGHLGNSGLDLPEGSVVLGGGGGVAAVELHRPVQDLDMRLSFDRPISNPNEVL